MSILTCPVCHQELKQVGERYLCEHRHSFDIAKQGYCNLLLNQSNKIHGDDKNMLLARKYIQDQGYYQVVLDGLITMIHPLQVNEILDIGCGIGYYTSNISKVVNAHVTGIDISKEALKIAAKKSDLVTYVVASNKTLPIKNSSVDLVMSIFSPLYEEELTRVVKDQGYVIVASPNPNHLIELKRIIYDDIIDKNEDRNDLTNRQFILLKEKQVKTVISLDQESIKQLFLMTPHYWTSSVSGKERLYKVGKLSTTIDVSIKLYQYQRS